MPRPSKPWFWKSRKSWFCTIEGERISLGAEREAAFKSFYRLMTAEKRGCPTGTEALSVLIDQ